MNRILFGVLSSSLILSLCACSGVRQSGGGGGGTGNATLSLTLRATPPSPSAHLSIVTFRATVTGVSLTPSSGSVVNVGLVSGTTGSYVAEFTRLQSDSALLSAGVSVPAGIYNSLAVTFSDVLLTFCTQPSSGVAGCSSGSLTQVPGSAGAATASSGALPLTVTRGEKLGLALDVNIPNAITASGQTISALNLAAPNVLTATVLQAPSSTTDLASGQLAHIDDLYGVVSSVSASAQSFTLQTAYRGSVAITAKSSTTYDPVCSTQSFSCVTSGALAAVDAILNVDGTLTIRNYSPVPFTAVSKDTIEGVVTVPPSSVNQVFDIAVTDASFAPSNSLLNGSIRPGDLVIVGVVTPQPFFVVNEGLIIPTNGFSGSTDVSPIQPGQTVGLFGDEVAPECAKCDLPKVKFSERRAPFDERTTQLWSCLLSFAYSPSCRGSAKCPTEYLDRHVGGQPGADHPRRERAAAQHQRPDRARARARIDRRSPDLHSPF
jgi:hypothetical protein